MAKYWRQTITLNVNRSQRWRKLWFVMIEIIRVPCSAAQTHSQRDSVIAARSLIANNEVLEVHQTSLLQGLIDHF